MNQDDIKNLDGQAEPQPADLGRRKFLNTAALVGLTGAGLSVGLSACNKETAPTAGRRAPSRAPSVTATFTPTTS